MESRIYAIEGRAGIPSEITIKSDGKQISVFRKNKLEYESNVENVKLVMRVIEMPMLFIIFNDGKRYTLNANGGSSYILKYSVVVGLMILNAIWAYSVVGDQGIFGYGNINIKMYIAVAFFFILVSKLLMLMSHPPEAANNTQLEPGVTIGTEAIDSWSKFFENNCPDRYKNVPASSFELTK